MDAEDVVDVGLGAEADEDVVAEQQVAVDLPDVTRDAVVLRPDALGRDERELRPAERLGPAGVELFGLLGELPGRVEEALSNDVVAAAFELLALSPSAAWACFGASAMIGQRDSRPSTPISLARAASFADFSLRVRRRRWPSFCRGTR